MIHEDITWRCDGRDVTVGLDRLGTGPVVLLLPALSSISTRRELVPLQQRLARWFTTVAIDWPGFGEQPRPYVDWRPEIYEAFLKHVFAQVVPRPFATVAAGHGAGYVIRHCAARPEDTSRIVLLSPTWRGPLPTMVGRSHRLFETMGRGFDPPVLGPMLYAMNVNRAVIGMMTRGHVYADSAWLTEQKMTEKLAVTSAPGARHSSARFVTGQVDPFASRDEQLQAAGRVTVPMLAVFSENAPRKSRAEMEALASLDNVQVVRVPNGKLSFYEEFPDQAAGAVLGFLGVHGSPAAAS
jgi:pimeloyl-ACP methyl ester carboxylesterase